MYKELESNTNYSYAPCKLPYYYTTQLFCDIGRLRLNLRGSEYKLSYWYSLLVVLLVESFRFEATPCLVFLEYGCGIMEWGSWVLCP
jgi:hypothetical protein